MAINTNIKSTTHPSFGIGKKGVTLFQGTTSPDASFGVSGDIFFKTGVNSSVFVKKDTLWKELQVSSEFLNSLSVLQLQPNTFLATNQEGTNVVVKTIDDIKTLLNLGTASTYNTGTVSGNIPVLDENNKIPLDLLPTIKVFNIIPVDTVAHMEEIENPQLGDLALVQENNSSYIWDGSKWSLMSVQSDVVSVAGKTGVVTLSATDISEGVLSTVRGGTGVGLYNRGDILVGNENNSLSVLSKGMNNNVLQIKNDNIVWDSLSSSSIGFTPNLNQRIISTNVQDAIIEVAAERSFTQASSVSPSPSNDGNDTAAIGIKFKIGDFWINTQTRQVYSCSNNATNAAVWIEVSKTGLLSLSQDLVPKLGGNLDLNNYSIVSSNNKNINISPDGSGVVTISGLTFPKSSGSVGQILKSDGSGNLVWGNDEKGEINTYSSLGNDTDGSQIIGTKVGVDLPFKRIKAGSGVTLSENSTSVIINSITNVVGNNIGTPEDGKGVYINKEENTLNFKRLIGDKNISLVETDNNIKISVSGLATIASTGNASDIIGKVTVDQISGLSRVATTNSYADLINIPAFGTAAYANTGTQFGNVPILNSEGKLSNDVLPPLAISNVYVVATIEERNALVVQTGDVAKVTSNNITYIYNGATWIEISAAHDDLVKSVNGKVGIITLSGTDISAARTPTNYAVAGPNIKQHLDGIDTKLGSLGTASKFNDLTDVQKYTTDDKNKIIKVNNTGTGLVFGQPLSVVATTGSFDDLLNKPTIVSSLLDLTDVKLTSVTDNQVLRYDHVSLKWINASLKYSDILNTPVLSLVATSGKISDTTGKLTTDRIDGLSTVATTGNYNDLTNKPTIPVKLDDLSDVAINSETLANAQVLYYDINSNNFVNKLMSYNDLTDKPTFTTKLNSLEDVDTTGIKDGSILVYKLADQKWVMGTNGGGGGGAISKIESLSEFITVTDPEGSIVKLNIDTTKLDISETIGTILSTRVSGLGSLATKNSVNWETTDIINKPILFSGNYNDLTNKPTIPSKTTDLSDIKLTNIVDNDILIYNNNSFINTKLNKIFNNTTNVTTNESSISFVVDSKEVMVIGDDATSSTEKLVINAKENEVVLKSISGNSNDNIDLVLSPQQQGKVIIGETSGDAKIQSDVACKLTIKAGDSSGSKAPNNLYLEGGDGLSGDYSGGNVYISGGQKYGTGVLGNVFINGIEYPITDGTINQVLMTNGNKQLGWIDLPVVDTSLPKNVLTITSGTSDILTNNNHVVILDKDTNHSITLPANTSISIGKEFIIKNTTQNIQTTIAGNGTDKIEGKDNIVLSGPYSTAVIMWSGKEWLQIK